MKRTNLPSVEELLLPLLQLLSQRALTIQDACRELARKLPLDEIELRELESNFTGSRFNPRVSGAWKTLDRAGLLIEGPVRLTKTASNLGREILARGLKKLSVDLLEELLPEYAALHRADRINSTATGFRDLALEYYACGRKLMADAAFSSAPVLLGYAIEMLLKMGLQRFKERWSPSDRDLVRSSHDLARLYRRTRELSQEENSATGALFDNTCVAFEFMEYARDNFARRYPSGATKLSGGRKQWSIGTTKLSVYDDCICQLDDGLAAHGGTPESSIIHAALHDPNPLVARLAPEIFRDNPYAFRSAVKYLASGGYDSRSYFATLRADPRQFEDFVASTQQRPSILSLHLAAWFCYPRDGEPDPDPLSSKVGEPLMGSQAAIIVNRLRSEFGPENVRVVSGAPLANHVIVHVFDRTAKQYWRELRFKGARCDGLWAERRNMVNALGDAIAKTKRQFKVKRPDLLQPPVSKST